MDTKNHQTCKLFGAWLSAMLLAPGLAAAEALYDRVDSVVVFGASLTDPGNGFSY